MNVADSVNLICSETGLDDNTGTEDRIKALACYNRAYRRIALETRCIKAFGRHPLAGFVELSLNDFASFGPSEVLSDASGAFGDRFLAADFVWFANPQADDIWHPGGETLVRLPMDRLITARTTEISLQPPTSYALESSRLHLDAAPNGTGTDQTYIVIYGSMGAPTLVEASLENAVVGINTMYHEDLICTLAACYVLEGYEGQEDRATYYRNLHANTLQMFKNDLIREGGIRPPNDGLDSWTTPNHLVQR